MIRMKARKWLVNQWYKFPEEKTQTEINARQNFRASRKMLSNEKQKKSETSKYRTIKECWEFTASLQNY